MGISSPDSETICWVVSSTGLQPTTREHANLRARNQSVHHWRRRGSMRRYLDVQTAAAGGPDNTFARDAHHIAPARPRRHPHLHRTEQGGNRSGESGICCLRIEWKSHDQIQPTTAKHPMRAHEETRQNAPLATPCWFEDTGHHIPAVSAGWHAQEHCAPPGQRHLHSAGSHHMHQIDLDLDRLRRLRRSFEPRPGFGRLHSGVSGDLVRRLCRGWRDDLWLCIARRVALLPGE
jgi:hypothetical protein